MILWNQKLSPASNQKRKKLGKLGEELAKKILIGKGYKFVCQNFHCLFGEIDLIFIDNKTLVFVEVKTRNSDLFGSPQEAVGFKKMTKIKKSIDCYYNLYPNSPQEARIDIVSIKVEGYFKKLTSVKHLINVS